MLLIFHKHITKYFHNASRMLARSENEWLGEGQERAREYYNKHYTHVYINDKRPLNTVGDGKKIRMISV